MQKSLQTKCLSNSQRCIQSDTFRDQTIALRSLRHFVDVDMDIGVRRQLNSHGR